MFQEVSTCLSEGVAKDLEGVFGTYASMASSRHSKTFLQRWRLALCPTGAPATLAATMGDAVRDVITSIATVQALAIPGPYVRPLGIQDPAFKL